MTPAAKTSSRKAKASTSSRKSPAAKGGGAAKSSPSTPSSKANKPTKKKTTSAKSTAAKAAARKSPAKKPTASKAAPQKAAKKATSAKAAKKATPARAAKKATAAKAAKKATAAKAAKRAPPAKAPPAKLAAKAPPAKALERPSDKAKAIAAAAKKAAEMKAAEATKVVAPKPAPKAVAPTPPPRPKRKRSSKVVMAEARENLDRIYGPITLPETNNILEKAVYLVLREGGTELTTTKAMKALMAEFVDWNEVRVSRSSELARLMSGTSKVAGIRRFHERSTRLREMIDQIYGDRNETSLEFLLDERPKGQLEYLEDFDDLGLHNAYALVQWLSEKEDLVLVSSEMATAAYNLGMIESAGVTKAKKALGELLKTRVDRVTMVAHLNKLGDLEYREWPTAMKEMLH